MENNQTIPNSTFVDDVDNSLGETTIGTILIIREGDVVKFTPLPIKNATEWDRIDKKNRLIIKKKYGSGRWQ